MKKTVADIFTKIVVFLMILSCADTILASMHRSLSMHQKRLNAPHMWRQQMRSLEEDINIQLKGDEFLKQALRTAFLREQAPVEENTEDFREVRLREQRFEDSGLRGVLKGHQRYVPSDEKPCEIKTQIVFIQGCPPGLPSLYLQLANQGLEFTRFAMQSQCNLEDPLSSLKKQEKLEQLFKFLGDGFDQDIEHHLQSPLSSFRTQKLKLGRRPFELLEVSQGAKYRGVPFVALCLQHHRKRDLAVLEWEKEERHELRTKTALPVVQERKQQKYQFKQSCKQQQKQLKQQSCVTFQKNKKLPKSQQQVKQIAHRKRG